MDSSVMLKHVVGSCFLASFSFFSTPIDQTFMIWAPILKIVSFFSTYYEGVGLMNSKEDLYFVIQSQKQLKGVGNSYGRDCSRLTPF